MKDSVFIDTNILIYYFQNLDEPRKTIARNLIHKNIEVIVLSTQVLGEFFNVMKKKGNETTKCVTIIEECMKIFSIAVIRTHHVSLAMRISVKYGFSYYDSLIVASALEAGCKTLFSEDLQHNQLIENQLRIINPFV